MATRFRCLCRTYKLVWPARSGCLSCRGRCAQQPCEACIAEEDISGVKNGISLSEAQLPHVRKIQQFQCTHPTHPTLLPPSMLRRADRSRAQSSGTHQQAASCPLIFCFAQAALATRKRGRAQTRSSLDRRLHRFCNSSPTAIIKNLAASNHPAKKHADFATGRQGQRPTARIFPTTIPRPHRSWLFGQSR